MKKNEIYQIQGTDYIDMTVSLLSAVDLESDIGNKNAYIGLKPNLVVASTADRGAVTHPEIVEGAIRYLKEHGFHTMGLHKPIATWNR